MNELFALLHLQASKPLISALLLPPVPFLLSILLGARVLVARRGLGWVLIGLSVLMTWFSCSVVCGQTLQWLLLKPPPALSAHDIAQIKKHQLTYKDTAIVVLGGGSRPVSSEYAVSNLTDMSLERLRYGIWLSRATGVPLAYSGGVGWAQGGGMPEAEIAARIAKEEFGHALRWQESLSRDTRENGAHTVPLLRKQGVSRLVVITHAWHMQRAVRAFEQAASEAGGKLTVEAAPINGLPFIETHVKAWMPSHTGFELVRMVLHESLGYVAGA